MSVTSSGECNLDMSPITTANIFQFLCYPHKNHGYHIFTVGDNSYKEVYTHGNIFYAAFYCTLSPTTLEAIGWFWCVPACDEIVLGAHAHQQHIKRYIYYQQTVVEEM